MRVAAGGVDAVLSKECRDSDFYSKYVVQAGVKMVDVNNEFFALKRERGA